MLIRPAQVRPAVETDVPSLAELAAATFPLAAPPHVTADSLAAFIEANLSARRFTDYLASQQHAVAVAEDETGVVGYTLLVFADPTDRDVLAVVPERPAAELSKVYVHPNAHGSGIAGLLVEAAIVEAEQRGAAVLWLGVNQENVRAQRFYTKSGFTRVGTKRFQVGAGLEHDFVFSLALPVQR